MLFKEQIGNYAICEITDYEKKKYKVIGDYAVKDVNAKYGVFNSFVIVNTYEEAKQWIKNRLGRKI